LLLSALVMTATTPWVRSKSKMAAWSWASITLRSETTMTAENSFSLLASCRSARKCAVQAHGVGLARARRVLDQVLSSRLLRQHRGDQLPRGVELMVAGEDELLDTLLAVALGHHVAAEDLQPAVVLPDLLPQVAGAATARVGRVALGAVIAAVEGEEARRRPSSRVAMCTSLLLTAKCTNAPHGKLSSGSAGCPLGLGWRSKRY
jgi:hypothetical protein